MEILGILLSLVSIVVAWYYGTRKKRLKNKIEGHKNTIKTIDSYTGATGYKAIIHDSFHCLSYCLCVLFLFFAIKEIFSFFDFFYL